MITPGLAAMNDLPVKSGLYILGVQPGTPAAKAGLQEDDIILSLGGQTLDEDHQFVNVLMKHKAGEQVELKVLRDGKELTLTVTLGERPRSSSN
jgi:S1-C subfamily serine protease